MLLSTIFSYKNKLKDIKISSHPIFKKNYFLLSFPFFSENETLSFLLFIEIEYKILILCPIKDMMLFLNWTRVAILYEDEYGLIRLQELVRSPPTKNIEIYIRQTNPANYRTVLREIKNKEIFNIIVDTDKEHIQLFFRTLLQLQMNNNKVRNSISPLGLYLNVYKLPIKHCC